MRRLVFLLASLTFLYACTARVIEEPAENSNIAEAPVALFKANAILRGDIGNGFAEVSYDAGRNMRLFVRANLFPTTEHYVTWIRNKETDEIVNIGELSADNANGSYSLTMRIHLDNIEHASDMRSFSTILISEEQSTRTREPSQSVLEGPFVEVATTGMGIYGKEDTQVE